MLKDKLLRFLSIMATAMIAAHQDQFLL